MPCTDKGASLPVRGDGQVVVLQSGLVLMLPVGITMSRTSAR